MWIVYLRHANMKNALFINTELQGTDVVGTLFLGARFDGANVEKIKNADLAYYSWWYNPMGTQKMSYKPIPGWRRLDMSVMGGTTVQENASREQVELYNERQWEPGEDK
jgi:uncharacterized protein YjbI with pentapeptide repeats